MKTKKTHFSSVLTTLILLLFVTLKSFALDYTITFTASGASATVGSVIVQNLTKGTTVTVPAGNTLNLTNVVTSVNQLISNEQGISICQSVVQGESMLTFFAKQAGNVQISIFGIDGKNVISCNKNLLEGSNSVLISLPKGAFAIKVAGNGYAYATKTLNINDAAGKSEITFLGNKKMDAPVLQKAKNAVTPMIFAEGDRLLFKGLSGDFGTIVIDSPIANQFINFNFVACQDANLNNYTTVKIGNQTWMAENLNATKYRNGNLINNILSSDNWWECAYPEFSAFGTSAYCNYENNPANGNVYGKLYNWFAVNDIRNISPIGWHVATLDEWATLINSLGVSPDLKIIEIGSVHWTDNINNETTNETGFTALPGGLREGYSDNWKGLMAYWWTATVSTVDISAYCVHTGIGGGYVELESILKGGGFSVRCVKD